MSEIDSAPSAQARIKNRKQRDYQRKYPGVGIQPSWSKLLQLKRIVIAKWQLTRNSDLTFHQAFLFDIHQ
jgi:hypothetical protein